jgi:hypothetical protein
VSDGTTDSTGQSETSVKVGTGGRGSSINSGRRNNEVLLEGVLRREHLFAVY